jgi:hypothetical protein
MEKDKFESAINECLNHIKVDYLPLHDIFRALYGFEKLTPNKNEFEDVLRIVEYLLKEKNVVSLEGPNMMSTSKTIPELIDYLTTKRDHNEYDEINYGIWFDKRIK